MRKKGGKKTKFIKLQTALGQLRAGELEYGSQMNTKYKNQQNAQFMHSRR